jgi:hypothetical protein
MDVVLAEEYETADRTGSISDFFSEEEIQKMKEQKNIDYVIENDTLVGANDFRFIIEPIEGYVVTNVSVVNELGVDKNNLLDVNTSSFSKDCHLTNITENLIVNNGILNSLLSLPITI